MNDHPAGAAALLRDHGLEGCEAALGAYIVRQRWAGAQGRTIESIEVVDAAVINEQSPVLLHTLTAVTYADGATVRYALPLGVRGVDDPLAERAPDYLIPWAEAPKPLLLYDAVGDPAYVEWLLEAIRERRVYATSTGEVRCDCPDPALLDRGTLSSVRYLKVEQSNTSVEVGDSIFFKHLRRVEAGPSHELEMSEALAAAGFTHVAPMLGRAVWAPAGAAPSLLVLVQRFLHNSSEGWALALTSLRALFAEVESMGLRDPAESRAAVASQDASFITESMRLGKALAELHLALAGPLPDPAMAPAPLTKAVLDRWASGMIAELDALLTRANASLDPLRAARDAVAGAFERLRELPAGGLLTRIHGDLHLGQLLRVDTGWVVLDFEGEPDRSPEQRRELTTPLCDVAGMLRSFDYAAAAAIHERAAPGTAEANLLLGYGDAWAEDNRDAFWTSYLATIGPNPLLPPPAQALVIRRAFELQKAVYEIGYELGHRPAWVQIPLRFLLGADGATGTARG